MITYADYEAAELEDFAPTVVHVDAQNAPIDEEGARLEAEFRKVVAG